MRLQIKPVYGWGWGDSQGNSIEVPAPFELEVATVEGGEPFRIALGHFQNGGEHPLSGLWILLTQRHATNDGQYTLEAFTEKPAVPRIAGQTWRVAGYASALPISA